MIPLRRFSLLIAVAALCSCSPQPLPARAPDRIALQHTTTSTGLVIEDLSLGRGEPCPPDATVEVNFTAMLAGKNGAPPTEFDSSEQRKRPLTIRLASSAVIVGLRDGISGMRPGGKRRLLIPWTLAYGENGRDPIPPKTDLIFEIELLRIIEPKP